MTDLYAGPWVGEFGWEIMGWQGYVRRIHNEMRPARTVVACRPSSRALYEDFATDFVDVPAGWEADFHRNAGHPHVEWPEPEGEAVWLPGKCHRPEEQEFVRYGSQVTSRWGDRVVVHARKMEKRGTEFRHWSTEKWVRLTEELCKQGVEVVAVGVPGEAILPMGARDYLGASLRLVMDLMRSASVVVGPSSGPIHLASLCEPEAILVWTDRRHVGKWGLTNEERLGRVWNPFGVPTLILDGWDPPVEDVLLGIRGMGVAP